MITVALSTSIGAPAESVWRALTEIDQRAVWDERVLGEVKLSRKRSGGRNKPAENRRGLPNKKTSSSPAPRRSVQWRFKHGGVPLVMRDDIIQAKPIDRIVSHITIGSMQFDQTLTFHSEDDETGPHTRLGMKLVARNSIAVLGEIIPRLDVQKFVMEYVDSTLRQIQKYCER